MIFGSRRKCSDWYVVYTCCGNAVTMSSQFHNTEKFYADCEGIIIIGEQ